MALGVADNNPGNLTVTGPNSFAYAGQTGVQSANGLFYAVFGTAQAGAAALITWLQNNIGSNDSTSLTTPSELASYYLNGSFGPLQNTSANPAAGNYLSSLENSTGLGANGQLTSVPINSIAAGIQKAEGNMALGNLFGTPGTVSGSTAANSGGVIGSLEQSGANLVSGVQNDIAAFGTGANYISQNGVAAGAAVLAGANPTAAAANPAGSLTGQLFAPLISWFNQQEAGFEKALPNAVERWAFGIVAVLLIGIGLWYLMGGPQKVQVAVNTAARAAPLALAA